METPVVHIREDIGEVTSDVATLKSDVWSLKSDLSVLKLDVATIKTDVKDLRTDLRDLRFEFVKMNDKYGNSIEGLKVQLATLNERFGHLPDKDFFVKSLILIATVLGGLMTFLVGLVAFQDHIRDFLVIRPALRPLIDVNLPFSGRCIMVSAIHESGSARCS